MAETVIPQEAIEAALEVYASEWPVIPLDVARLRCVKLLTAALPSLREAILRETEARVRELEAQLGRASQCLAAIAYDAIL